METADKDDKQGCMGAVERPPSTTGVCACLHKESGVPCHRYHFQQCPSPATFRGHWPQSYQGTQGGDIQQCVAGQYCRSHLSALFSQWDIFKGHYKTGPSVMLMTAVFLGTCVLLLLLHWHLLRLSSTHQTCDTMFRDKFQDDDKAVHYRDGQVIIRSYPIGFSRGRSVELIVWRWASCEHVRAEQSWISLLPWHWAHIPPSDWKVIISCAFLDCLLLFQVKIFSYYLLYLFSVYKNIIHIRRWGEGMRK